MTVQTLLDLTLPPLAPGDTVGCALERLSTACVEQLPVVDEEGQLAALISADTLAAYPSLETSLSMLPSGPPVFVLPDTHLYDAGRLMTQHGLDVLPIASEERVFFGVITRDALFDRLGGMVAHTEPGAIITLEVPAYDYSLSRIAHAIEENGARILSILTEKEEPNFGSVRITMKLNTTDSARVRHVLEHYGYHVTSVYNDEETQEELLVRVQEFMRYLEV
jgi:acetoin utilization protein AcuB